MIELEACRIRHLHAIAADLRYEEKVRARPAWA